MTSSPWRPSSTGYERDGYRIVALDGEGEYRWRLDRRPEGSFASGAWSASSYHRRLRSAKFRADAFDMEALHERRVIWRAVLGAAIVLTSLFAMRPVTSLGGFILVVLGLAVGVRLLAEAGTIQLLAPDDVLIDSWPRLERLALRVMDAFARRAAHESGVTETAKVRVLPPNPRDVVAGGRIILLPPAEAADAPLPPPRPVKDPIGYQHASPMHVC